MSIYQVGHIAPNPFATLFKKCIKVYNVYFATLF